MKVAFYFDNRKISDIDLSKPHLGNPGIGGTEYMFLLISYYLALNEGFDVHLFVPVLNKLPQNLMVHKVADVFETFKQCETLSVDYLICRSFYDKGIYKNLETTKLKVLLWAHNFAKIDELNIISKCDNVVKYVCVSSKQLDLLYGHPVYKKSTYIFNAFVPEIYESVQERRKSICYVGSIIPNKGFDVCAKIWRKLADEGYDVELDVVGSGRLYNSSTKLGKYSVAKEEYEDKFIPFLLFEGKLSSKVHFHGVLNHEDKIKTMSTSYIGLPNPTGNTETFGISFVEFEALGVPVVAKAVCGLKDTVNDYLCKDEKEIYQSCKEIFSLSKEEYDKKGEATKKYVEKFAVKKIIDDWIYMLNNMNDNDFHKSDLSGLTIKFRNLINLYRNVQV